MFIEDVTRGDVGEAMHGFIQALLDQTVSQLVEDSIAMNAASPASRVLVVVVRSHRSTFLMKLFDTSGDPGNWETIVRAG